MGILVSYLFADFSVLALYAQNHVETFPFLRIRVEYIFSLIYSFLVCSYLV